MSVEYMRECLLKVYPTKKWRVKVNRMSDTQVIAVYHKFLFEGKFDKKPRHCGTRDGGVIPASVAADLKKKTCRPRANLYNGQITFDDVLRTR